jgi:hypothetical protein
MTRFAVALLLCLSFLAGTTPRSALAHGPALKGMLLTHSTSWQGTTGTCTCNAQWFTMGLTRGTVRATVKLGACQNAPKGGVCSVEVFLMQGDNQLAGMTPSCFVSKSPCNKTRSFSYHVTQRGAYYLLVQGIGAYAIHYTLSLKAPIYRLHCNKTYC